MAAKLLLARIPVGYGVWRKLNLFRHGRMDDAQYALSVFQRHWRRYMARSGQAAGCTLLELGPGDSLNTAVIAHVHGVGQVILVDAVQAASGEMATYRGLIAYLEAQGLPIADLAACRDVGELLECCNARYLSEGLASLREVDDASVDFVFSHAVLEHVRRAEFVPHMTALYRILKPSGFMSHRIDLKDHLGGALNNLRVSSRYWESPLFADSGFYTNRLRASEILGALAQCGFACEVLQQDDWTVPPLDRGKLAKEFSGLSDEDLRISGVDVVCRKAGSVY